MDPTDFGPGTVTWLSGTGTVLLGAGLWLRKWLSRDATERAMDSADIAVIRRLTDLLDIERDARREAEAKADQFARERNELVISVGRLQGKVLALTSQLAMATKTLARKNCRSELARDAPPTQ
ncbi:hypothetical protein [Pseudomonas sp. NBRC 111134]|uniref:hypothetical protein n=1 Tax=Pseudomonas sp. NBRC 111134 TaxID=1661049 RepID=UPI00076123E7|nr:hypothetical protein [Pseudomonas sp. NBRC 111134]